MGGVKHGGVGVEKLWKYDLTGSSATCTATGWAKGGSVQARRDQGGVVKQSLVLLKSPEKASRLR